MMSYATKRAVAAVSSPPRRERVAEGRGSHAGERNLERGGDDLKDDVVAATRAMLRPELAESRRATSASASNLD